MHNELSSWFIGALFSASIIMLGMLHDRQGDDITKLEQDLKQYKEQHQCK